MLSLKLDMRSTKLYHIHCRCINSILYPSLSILLFSYRTSRLFSSLQLMNKYELCSTMKLILLSVQRWMTARMNMQTSCKKPTSFRCDHHHYRCCFAKIHTCAIANKQFTRSFTYFHLLNFELIAVCRRPFTTNLCQLSSTPFRLLLISHTCAYSC